MHFCIVAVALLLLPKLFASVSQAFVLVELPIYRPSTSDTSEGREDITDLSESLIAFEDQSETLKNFEKEALSLALRSSLRAVSSQTHEQSGNDEGTQGKFHKVNGKKAASAAIALPAASATDQRKRNINLHLHRSKKRHYHVNIKKMHIKLLKCNKAKLYFQKFKLILKKHQKKLPMLCLITYDSYFLVMKHLKVKDYYYYKDLTILLLFRESPDRKQAKQRNTNENLS